MHETHETKEGKSHDIPASRAVPPSGQPLVQPDFQNYVSKNMVKLEAKAIGTGPVQEE